MPIPVFLNESSLPRVIGGLAFEGVDIYPDQRLGIKVRYGTGADLKADAFLYNHGHNDIPVNLRSEDVGNWFQEAYQNVQMAADQGLYLDLDIRASQFLHLPPDAPDPFCLWGVFAYRQAPSPLVSFLGTRISHLALRTDRGYINKVRFTYPEMEKDEEANFGRFLAFLVEWTFAVQEFGKPP